MHLTWFGIQGLCLPWVEGGGGGGGGGSGGWVRGISSIGKTLGLG